jgi:dipeptidyl aminopeptidase/acylaminoacyl peptidase
MKLAGLLLLAGLVAAQKQPFDFGAMMKLTRISEPKLSPDGKLVAFTAQTVDVASNARPRQVWVVPVAGGAPKAITSEGQNWRPVWSPDGRLAVISTRSGSAQVWTMKADGTGAKQQTNLSTEADGVLWSPAGKHLIFTSDVYPECGADDGCNQKRLGAEKDSKVKARVYTTLLYRHWNEFRGARRKHLMSMVVDAGKVTDLTPGDRDVPPFSLGGPDDYAISPDGAEVTYVSNPDAKLAYSTNNELYTVSVEGGEPARLTNQEGSDMSPVYSPDGQYLAWRAQMEGGYESDRWRLMLMDRVTKKVTVLTERTDRSVQSMTFSPDSTTIYYTLEDRGRQTVSSVPVGGGGSRLVLAGASYDDVQLSPDGKTMVYTKVSGSMPSEIFRNAGGNEGALAKLNEAVLANYELTPLEEISAVSTDKARVQSFVVKPYGFDPAKKYPVLFLIHGGPEGNWGESWSYRWNPQVFAAAGYLVVMPNPRGSTGYGQKFTAEIQADWGGKVFDDVMAVVDQVAALPYADGGRMAAAGGSYGGYFVNWLLGHTDRFQALVSHAGVFDLRSMAGETEELWFVNWEFKGMPWDSPEIYQKWSPSYYVNNFKTPTLVIHGELDYRVPVGQGMHLFTALQTKEVPSKLLLYPDEGHWILKPQNSELWYRSVIEWLDEFTRKKP